MSLDVYLEGAPTVGPGTGIFIREAGSTRELTREEWDQRFPGREPVIAPARSDKCYSANITHNLGDMAAEAEIYEPLWRPEEVGITKASELIEPLTAGLLRLCTDPIRYRRLNPENGWGTYEGLVQFVAGYLQACREYPGATVRVWR
ncbi:hypothetical protein [Methylobacterium fujisawaense]|uniref:hypothetical protein n=1 Tax=Methylobacterium fujisawaense TaxID=107400 RepID=UPI002F36076E